MRDHEISSGCLDENRALDLVQGRLTATDREGIEEHIDRCARCRSFVADAVHGLRGTSFEDVADKTPRRPFPPPLFTAGETIAGGRHLIVRYIARGGMGEVYEAKDKILGTRVAIKTLKATISNDPVAIKRLMQEVTLARLITHENVCRIFDLGWHEWSSSPSGERIYFITMELISGATLAARLRGSGAMSCEKVLPIAKALLSAIGAAHKAGVVHRDFKSENVMIECVDGGTPSRVVVTDFGLARPAAGHTGSGLSGEGAVGTPAYMAPEQLLGKPATPSSDIYALGMVMFEMLTGRLPFENGPLVECAVRRLHERAPPLRRFVPAIDRAWEEVVAACLERDPARRPKSIEEIASALAKASSGSRPAWPGRSRRILGAGALMALVVAAVATVRHPSPPLADASHASSSPPTEAARGADLAVEPQEALMTPPIELGPSPPHRTAPARLRRAGAAANRTPNTRNQERASSRMTPAEPSVRRSDDDENGFWR